MPEQSSRPPEGEANREQLRELAAFSSHLSSDAQAADRVRASGTPEEIVAIASEFGYSISVDTLRSSLWDLQGNHWPWAGESGRWRIQFFRQTSK
ncbi:MAG: Nif11-like leader peptide family natural product precursor [Cyanobium sp. M30B3]|nr:MAG: Nif11-like leader peptide family natural product precursor [Cyanobium sp. M30B3]